MSAVARVVLREQVKELILERILRGEYAPGDRLVETRIAQELGTSQAPVREALAPRYSMVPARRTRTRHRTWLDTFDWRLHRAGLTLESVTGRGPTCREDFLPSFPARLSSPIFLAGAGLRVPPPLLLLSALAAPENPEQIEEEVDEVEVEGERSDDRVLLRNHRVRAGWRQS